MLVVVEVGFENSAQAGLVQSDDMIEAFTANRADQSLDVRILPGRLCGGVNFFDAKPSCCFREFLVVAPIPVPQQIPRGAFPRKGFDQLMSDPVGRWMFGHCEVHDSPSIMRQDHEDTQHPEEYSRHNEKVRRNQVLRVILEECAPRLDQQLMPKGEDFGVEHNSVSETPPERRKQREDDRDHIIRTLQTDRTKCNRITENEVFGRDRSLSSQIGFADVARILCLKLRAHYSLDNLLLSGANSPQRGQTMQVFAIAYMG